MRTFNITVNGQTYVVDVEEVGGVQTAAPCALLPLWRLLPWRRLRLLRPRLLRRLPWRAANPSRRPCPATSWT